MSPSLSDVLLVIDVQVAFDHPTYWGTKRSNPSFEANLTTLLRTFRNAGPPKRSVIHVYHSSRSPSSPLHQTSAGINLQPYARPLTDEAVISKHENSAFIGTQLEAMLKDLRVQRFFIAGLTTDHCVSTTARMAANLHVTAHLTESGIQEEGAVILVQDATATWEKDGFDAETVHQVNVASLRGEFCEIMTTSQVVSLLADGTQ